MLSSINFCVHFSSKFPVSDEGKEGRRKRVDTGWGPYVLKIHVRPVWLYIGHGSIRDEDAVDIKHMCLMAQ